jgi:hypothetical protein
VLEQVLTNLTFEDLRTSSLVSKRFLDASNTVRTSVTFDKWMCKEKIARLAARFSNATAAAFARKRGCSQAQLEAIEEVLSSMTRIQSLDLSGLQYEISVRSTTLASMLRSVRSLRVLTLKEPLLCTERKDREQHWYWKIADPVVPDVAATFRTLEQVLLSVGEQCSELEALHILPASTHGWAASRLPLGDYEAAYTQLTKKCPRLVVLDPVIADQSDHEVPCSLDVSTCIGTKLSSVTVSYSSTDALSDMLRQLCSLSYLQDLKVVPFPRLGGKLEDPA